MTEPRASESGPRAAPPRQHRPLAGIAANAAAYSLVSLNDALGKLLVSVLPVAQMLALRSAFALLFMTPLLLLARRDGRAVFATLHLKTHLARSVVQMFSMVTFYVAIVEIDLARITAILFATPLFVALFSGPLLGERVRPAEWLAVAVGFVGTAIVADFGIGQPGRAELFAVASAASWAVAQLLTRRLSATDSPTTIIAYFNLVALPCMTILAAFNWAPVSGRQLLTLAVVGFCYVFAQWLGARALGLARAATIAPVQYTQLIWATLFGWAIWSELPTAKVMLGAGLIAVAGTILLIAETRRARAA